MQVIPVINCPDFECVKKRLAQIQTLGSEWVHIDVADGKFAPVKIWDNPNELKLAISNLKLEINVEAHLMVECPEDVLEKWLAAGAKRIIVHFEVIRNREKGLNFIFEKCSEYGAEAMLAINPETPAEDLIPFLDVLLFVQVLAVSPGFSGQKFDVDLVEKIKFLRERAPDIEIEVDGGMNPETAKLVRDAGADIITSASYIFNNDNPKKAYRNLETALASI